MPENSARQSDLPAAQAGVPAQLRRALILLALVGLLGSGALTLAKAATLAGMAPLSVAFWQAAGGGVPLLLAALVRRETWPPAGTALRYGLICGLFTIALPYAVAYLAVPHLGAGTVGLFYALPPLFTYALAVPLGVEKSDLHRLAGVLLGLAGAVCLVATRGSIEAPSATAWLLAGFAVPLSLAISNIYRVRAWPPGIGPLPLAALMLLSAAALLLAASLASGAKLLPEAGNTTAIALLAGLAVVATAMFALYFELQRLAGPVFFSQIGYLMATAALGFGWIVFGERYSLFVVPALLLTVAGVVLISRRRPARR